MTMKFFIDSGNFFYYSTYIDKILRRRLWVQNGRFEEEILIHVGVRRGVVREACIRNVLIDPDVREVEDEFLVAQGDSGDSSNQAVAPDGADDLP